MDIIEKFSATKDKTKKIIAIVYILSGYYFVNVTTIAIKISSSIIAQETIIKIFYPTAAHTGLLIVVIDNFILVSCSRETICKTNG